MCLIWNSSFCGSNLSRFCLCELFNWSPRTCCIMILYWFRSLVHLAIFNVYDIVILKNNIRTYKILLTNAVCSVVIIVVTRYATQKVKLAGIKLDGDFICQYTAYHIGDITIPDYSLNFSALNPVSYTQYIEKLFSQLFHDVKKFSLI